MSFPHRARVRTAIALGLLLLPPLFSGQTLQAQHPLCAYYEHHGNWCCDYDMAPGQARVAVLAALADMHMGVGQEGFYPYGGGFIDTKTPDNLEARITIRPSVRYGPGITQIRVCIGGFGTHRKACSGILDEIGRHLDAARHSSPAPGVVVVPSGPVAGPPPVIIVRPGAAPPFPVK